MAATQTQARRTTARKPAAGASTTTRPASRGRKASAPTTGSKEAAAKLAGLLAENGATDTSKPAPAAAARGTNGPKVNAPATAIASAAPESDFGKIGPHEPVQRYRGTVKLGKETFTCVDTCANGHITIEPAQTCSRRLQREHEGAALVEDENLARVDRYRGVATPKEQGKDPLVCDCSYAHKTEDVAIECAGKLARKHGLTV